MPVRLMLTKLTYYFIDAPCQFIDFIELPPKISYGTK